MGVKKLLKRLDSIMQEKNLKNLNITKVGIDGHGWIYESLEEATSDFLFYNNVRKLVAHIARRVTSILSLGRTYQALMLSWSSTERV
jgi:hypothetical protein